MLAILAGCAGHGTGYDQHANAPTPPPLEAFDPTPVESQVTDPVADVPVKPGGFGITSPLELPRHSADASTFKTGDQYESSWPSQWVADVGTGSLVFLPHWEADNPDSSHLSFALFSLATPMPADDYSILFDWRDGIDNYDNLWIGIGNFERNSWDWQAGRNTNAVSFSAESHLNASDQIYLAVVCLGNSQWELNRITPTATSVEPLQVQYLISTDGTYFSKVVISWDHTIGADGYKLQYKNNEGGSPSEWTDLATVSGGANTRYEHTLDSPAGKECAPYIVYEYRAKGTYQTHESTVWSNTDSGYRVLGDVTGLSATNGTTHDKIIVSWDEVPGAERYKLQYKNNGGGLPAEWEDLYYLSAYPDPSYSHSWSGPSGRGSEKYTDYEYRAKAEWSSFESLAWSTTATGYRPGRWRFKWLDFANRVGMYNSLAVVNGNPAISYYDWTNGDLKFVRATTADGRSWGSPIAVDTTGNVGQYTSLVVVDGYPAICYFDDSNDVLKYVRATDTSGSTWGIPLTVDTPGAVLRFMKLIVANGNPAIS